MIDEQEKDACVHGLPQLISIPGSLWAIQGLEEPKNYVDRMRATPERAREFTHMLFEVHQNLANQVVDLLDLTGVERMIDLGGNSGVISMALLRKYPALTSTVVDIENVCVAGREIAEEEGFSNRITYHSAEFADNEFPAGFDLVLQCDVAVYSIELLQKLHRSLKPGGRLIVQLPAYQWLWSMPDVAVGHQRRYSARDTREKLSRAGLSVERILHTNALLLPFVAVERLWRRRS